MRSRNFEGLSIVAIAIYLAIATLFLLSPDSPTLLTLLYTIANKLLIICLCFVGYRHITSSILILGLGSLIFYQIAVIITRILVYVHTSNTIDYAIMLSQPYIFIPLGIITGASLLVLKCVTR